MSLEDHAYHYGFYTYSYKDLLIENNTIDSGPVGASTRYSIGIHIDGDVADSSATVRGNTIIANDPGSAPTGIWIRSETVPVVVERNYVEIQDSASYARGIQLQGVTNVTVANNTVVRTGGGGNFWAVDLLNAGSSKVYNNTVVEGSGASGSPGLIRILYESTPDIRNNILANLGTSTSRAAIEDFADAGFNIAYLQNNLVYGPGSWPLYDDGTNEYTSITELNDPSKVTDGTAGSAAGNVTADPAFDGTGTYAEQYRLTASSPVGARHGGQDLSGNGVTTDYFGTTRTAPFSIGAHEYSADTAPGVVTPAAPADGATGQAVSVTLQWEGGSGAAAYRVYLDTNAAPTTLITTTIDAQIALDDYFAAAPGTTYYWKVEAFNDSGTNESSARSFTTSGS